MPTVELSVTVNAPINRVVAIARETSRFPEFMPDVKSIEVLERSDDGNCQKTKWEGRIPQFNMTVRWSQEEIWSAEGTDVRSIFKQIEGDYDKMEGYWLFKPNATGCEFITFLDYEYNVPLVGALIKKVIHHIVEQNLKGVMMAIAARAEAT